MTDQWIVGIGVMNRQIHVETTAGELTSNVIMENASVPNRYAVRFGSPDGDPKTLDLAGAPMEVTYRQIYVETTVGKITSNAMMGNASGLVINAMAGIHSAETGCVYIFQLPQTVSQSFAVQKSNYG